MNLNQQHDGPSAPPHPRKCNDCQHRYGVLVKSCPQCGSTDTEFDFDMSLREFDEKMPRHERISRRGHR